MTSYDVPRPGDPWTRGVQSDWEESLLGRCEYDDLDPDCMTFDYDVYARQPDGGLSPSSVPTDEDDDREYPCVVEDLDPPPGPVEVGTVIRVTIVCGPRDDDDGDGDGSDGSTSDNGSASSSTSEASP